MEKNTFGLQVGFGLTYGSSLEVLLHHSSFQRLTFHSGLLSKCIWTRSSSFSSNCDHATLMLSRLKGSNAPSVIGLSSSLPNYPFPSRHIRTRRESPTQIHFVRSQCHYKSCLARYSVAMEICIKHKCFEFEGLRLNFVLCPFLSMRHWSFLSLPSASCETVDQRSERTCSATYWQGEEDKEKGRKTLESLVYHFTEFLLLPLEAKHLDHDRQKKKKNGHLVGRHL